MPKAIRKSKIAQQTRNVEILAVAQRYGYACYQAGRFRGLAQGMRNAASVIEPEAEGDYAKAVLTQTRTLLYEMGKYIEKADSSNDLAGTYKRDLARMLELDDDAIAGVTQK